MSGIFEIFLFVAGYSIVAFSLIPLVRSDNWVFRIFEYPRAQKLVINLIVLVVFATYARWAVTHHVVFATVLLLNVFYLTYLVFPYTKVARTQLKKFSKQDQRNSLTIFIANVYQDNRKVDQCLQSIANENPDLVLLVEVDQWWYDQLNSNLAKAYQYQVACPLENTYGIVLFSKLELVNPEIKFLVEDDVPSIHTQVALPSNKIIRLFGLHPKPPVPQESPRSTERDAEILLVGERARELKEPVIVAGDLNDVAWSYSTKLFLKISGLLDPRRGRGFFNTFNARHWFFRWPLDHLFCSAHFSLCHLKRLPSIQSDHFPILVKLCLDPGAISENQKEALPETTADEREAEEKIRKGLR